LPIHTKAPGTSRNSQEKSSPVIAGSTVSYNGTSPQTLPSTFTTYFNLTSNNTAGVTGFAGLTVQALLRVQAGTFTSSSTYNNVQIDAGATLAARQHYRPDGGRGAQSRPGTCQQRHGRI